MNYQKHMMSLLQGLVTWEANDTLKSRTTKSAAAHIDEGARSKSMRKVIVTLLADGVLSQATSQPAQLYLDPETDQVIPPQSEADVQALGRKARAGIVHLLRVGDDQQAYTSVATLLRFPHVYVITADTRTDETSLIGILSRGIPVLTRAASKSGITVLVKSGQMPDKLFANAVNAFIRADSAPPGFRCVTL